MAHNRLLSPLPTIVQLFGPIQAMTLPEGSESRRRLEELDDNRLNVGPLKTVDGYMFTIYKASNLESRGDAVNNEGCFDVESTGEHISLQTLTSTCQAPSRPLPHSPRSDVFISKLGPAEEATDGADQCRVETSSASSQSDVTHGHYSYRSEFSSRLTLVEHLTSNGV
jgi:hypothetical protein